MSRLLHAPTLALLISVGAHVAMGLALLGTSVEVPVPTPESEAEFLTIMLGTERAEADPKEVPGAAGEAARDDAPAAEAMSGTTQHGLTDRQKALADQALQQEIEALVAQTRDELAAQHAPEAPMAAPPPEPAAAPEPPEESLKPLARNIYYELSDRHHAFLYKPNYLCQFGGKVTVNIVVDPQGRVLRAAVNRSASERLDHCLEVAALRAARASTFNPSGHAASRQQGTITYVFQGQ